MPTVNKTMRVLPKNFNKQPLMQKIRAQIASIPLLKSLANKTQIAPEYLAIGIAILAFFVIQKTPIGLFFSNMIALLLIMRDALLTLRSSAPKVADLKKHVVAFCLFSFFVLLDNLCVGTVVPLFGMIKLVVLGWTSSSSDNANTVHENLFAKIPLEYLQAGNDIDVAVREAAKTLDENMKASKDK